MIRRFLKLRRPVPSAGQVRCCDDPRGWSRGVGASHPVVLLGEEKDRRWRVAVIESNPPDPVFEFDRVAATRAGVTQGSKVRLPVARVDANSFGDKLGYVHPILRARLEGLLVQRQAATINGPTPARTTVRCTGKDSITRDFYCELRWDDPRLTLRFFSHPDAPGDFFEAGFEALGASELRVAIMAHHSHPNFIAKGIPEAAIREAAKQTGRQVVSSRNGREPEQFRTASADKVWERLIKLGLATMREDDRYVYLG